MLTNKLHFCIQQVFQHLKPFIFFFFFIFCANILLGQNNKDTSLLLVGDTLFTNKGFSLFVGENIIAGQGSLQNGWYKTMRFNSVLNFPTMFSSIVNPKRATDDDDAGTAKNNDLLRDNIRPTDTLTIEKITKHVNKRHGYWYALSLHINKVADIACFDIVTALIAKELILPTLSSQ